MKKLAVLLGSGFSKPAGLPLAREINDYFLRDNAERILKFSSGEFMWDDFANDTYKHNGRIGYDHLAYGILLNEFVNLFVEEKKEFTNYEEFYQYVIDNVTDASFIEKLQENSINSFKNHFPHINENPYYDNYTHAIVHFQSREFGSLINHLISDLLYVRMDQKEIEGIYKWFHLFFDGYESIDFFTLNHDLLLESLMAKIIDKSFSDGFSRNQKVLKSSGGEPLKLFQGEFPEPISILKLHGSIDIYRYVVAEQKGGIMTPTGEYLFFKTNNYYEKQIPERYDPETEEKVQTFHWEIDPQFITGTRKKDILNKPGIYKDLFNEFKKRIMECQKLIVFGYSFGDEHVNEIIQLAFRKSRRLRKVINVNPSKELPFDKMNCIVCNLKNSTELNGSLNISRVNQMKESIITIWFVLIKTFIRR